MMRRSLYVLGTALLLVRSLSGAESTSFVDVLHSQDRWAQVTGLRDWQGPLGPADIEQLKEFVASERGKDWVLYSLGERLLRRTGGGQGPVPPEVEKAEEILLGVAWESDISVFYQRDDAAELTELGPAIIPLLKEVIDFQELRDYSRRMAAIEALARLGDASLVPFLKEHLGNPKWPDYGSTILDAILRLEPTFENADFVASTMQPSMTIGPPPSTKLPPAISMYLFKRSLERLHGGQEPGATLAYLEELDTPEAFKKVSDIVLQHEVPPTNQPAGAGQPPTWVRAAWALANMHGGDPCPVFQAALEQMPLEENQVFVYLIHPLVGRGFREAIPVLQQRRAAIAQCRAEIESKLVDLGREAGTADRRPPSGGPPASLAGQPPRSFPDIGADMEAEVRKDLELQRRDMELAAALAAFGVDYETNALRVRLALGDWDTWPTALQVVNLLHDDATVDELCRLLVARDPWSKAQHPAARAARAQSADDAPDLRDEFHRGAIVRLGEIGSPRAHDALAKVARESSLLYLEDAGRALRSIGKANNRPDIQLEGEDFIAIAQYIGYLSRPRTEPFPLPDPEYPHELELARRAQAAALRQPVLGLSLQPSSLWLRSRMQPRLIPPETRTSSETR
jgi:hypothetical protein